MKVLAKGFRLCLAAACLLFLPDLGSAEGVSIIGETIDTLEQQLEMGRHDQFIDLKQRPSSSLNEFTTDGCSGGLSVGWEHLAGRIGQTSGS